MNQETQICVICSKPFSEYGNNPAPVKPTGQCCDDCNLKEVIPARIKMLETKEASQ